MTTKREYLKQQGITVGVRGRFSGAAKVALQEAVSKGITFADEKTNKAKQPPIERGVVQLPGLPPLPNFDILTGHERRST